MTENISSDALGQAETPESPGTNGHTLRHGGTFHKKKHIAVVTMGVKLGDETRGYTRFRAIAELLVREGFKVDLITSRFQHWEKAHRDTSKACYQGLPYTVLFIDEPGYTRNLDLARIRSHRQAARALRQLLATTAGPYDLIYAEIPPNDVARTCVEFAQEQGIPFVADINDLWPEAMRMVIDIPLISDIAFYPFSRDAKAVYRGLTAAVGTSREYTERPMADRHAPYPHATVYVGNDMAAFDAGAAQYAPELAKPAKELWVTYAGTLGASYDLGTLVEAAALLAHPPQGSPVPLSGAFANLPPIRVKILGDGPDRARLEERAAQLGAPVDFCGYLDYAHMAAYLSISDIVVNSLVKSAAQSIVGKIGDYLASGKPLINTGSSPEFRSMVAQGGFGVNIAAEDPQALADAIAGFAHRESLRKIMGMRARTCAEKEFDQRRSYQRIADLIHTLV
ncbi:MAG: glycosyltransferase family 4 protein [Coriobacteriaceae bacterium]|nr:glycosyltransferase family 4 protein [Coriobacteriaceae bacterium]